jgi:hypothetical protein
VSSRAAISTFAQTIGRVEHQLGPLMHGQGHHRQSGVTLGRARDDPTRCLGFGLLAVIEQADRVRSLDRARTLGSGGTLLGRRVAAKPRSARHESLQVPGAPGTDGLGARRLGCGIPRGGGPCQADPPAVWT